MERTLENVHVVIYSKKMLKEAIKRLNNHGQNIETDIMCEYEFHGNDLLIYHDGLFKVIQCLPTHPNHEVTLNDLCEMIIDKEEKEDNFAVLKEAHKNGKVIQFYDENTSHWFDTIDKNPLWNTKVKYRIKPEEKLKINDWVFVQLKGNEDLGFSVQKLIFEHSVKYHNNPNCPHSAKKISEELAERLRKALV